jgi:hypothetical protein
MRVNRFRLSLPELHSILWIILQSFQINFLLEWQREKYRCHPISLFTIKVFHAAFYFVEKIWFISYVRHFDVSTDLEQDWKEWMRRQVSWWITMLIIKIKEIIILPLYTKTFDSNSNIFIKGETMIKTFLHTTIYCMDIFVAWLWFMFYYCSDRNEWIWSWWLINYFGNDRPKLRKLIVWFISHLASWNRTVLQLQHG